MLTDERHRVIRDELAAKGSVVAAALAARFGVSEDTVRRDLRELAKGGECRRVYGGGRRAGSLRRIAECPKYPRQRREVAPCGRRDQIAVPATDALHRWRHDEHRDRESHAADLELTVATNSIGVVSALADHTLIELIVLGGVFDREAGECLGGDTLRAVAQISADLFVLGSCGVDASRGATAFNSAEAEVKRAMAQGSAAS